MVVKVDDLELQRQLGVVGREPRGAIAWKSPPSTATTQLLAVAWNVGRTGHMVPFAQLEPVQVSGVTVKLATLHNEEDLRRKDVRDGDEVRQSAGRDPEWFSHLQAAEAQRRSPVTEPPVKSRPRHARSSRRAACGHLPHRAGCRPVFQAVKHFVGAMDIDGLGEENARRFLDEGLIKDTGDIYDLTAERLVELERFGETSAANLVQAIEASKSQPFHLVLYALGIPGIGFVNARNLARQLRSMDALLAATEEELTAVEGMGPIWPRPCRYWPRHRTRI